MLEDICDVTRSINFAKSQDSQSQCYSPRNIIKNGQKYKCFKCYGTNSYRCVQCSGKQAVSSSNPMAVLLNNILMKKLNIKKQEEKDEFESVQTIKEVQEDNDQKKMICSYCNIQCEYSIIVCSQCPYLVVCQRCSYRSQEHIHWIDGKQMTTSIGAVSQERDKKHCYNCNRNIEDCFSICRTCEKKSCNFWICDICSAQGNYVHSKDHIMQIVMDYDNFKEHKLDSYSQQFQQEFQRFSIDSEKMEEPEPPKRQLKLFRQTSSIVQVLQNNDQSPLLRQKSQNIKKNDDQISRVRFQLDGLFSSYDFNQSVKSKNILRPPSVLKQEGFSCDVSEASKSKQKDKQKENKSYEDCNEYTFFGYKCDICQIQPIKNVKYHCKQCQDFDSCAQCYQNIELVHQHQHFERIVGSQIRQRQFERISNCRQTNMRATIVPKKPRNHLRSKTHRFNTLLS